jgi:CheY-like chemotaxis protein
MQVMPRTSRILIIDDNRAIHDDFRKILAPPGQASVALNALEAALFGDGNPAPATDDHEVVSAYQGQEAVDIVQRAENDGSPFAMAFVDYRMPPGFDGIETVKRLWTIAPHLEIAICTAFSDYTPEEISTRLGHPQRLVILRKPFDPLEVQELAARMVTHWTARAGCGSPVEDQEDSSLNGSSGSVS